MAIGVHFIAGGEFGAYMQVHIQNDGPVTLQFETPNIPKPKEVVCSCILTRKLTTVYFSEEAPEN